MRLSDLLRTTALAVAVPEGRTHGGYCCLALAAAHMTATDAKWIASRAFADAVLEPALVAEGLSLHGDWADEWADPSKAPTREQFMLNLADKLDAEGIDTLPQLQAARREGRIKW